VIRLARVIIFLGPCVAAGALHAAPDYPVAVGPTGRYLVDKNRVPFLIAGESPQAMIGRLNLADAEFFFANRRSHRFNAVWINLLCGSYTGCNSDATTFDGIAPFKIPGDLSTPNEAYFHRADQILKLAAKYGFLVILDPAETGYWLGILESNGVEKARNYGRYLGKRYGSFDNILWMHGNDFQSWNSDPNADPVVQAVTRGIQDFDLRHIHTLELNYLVSNSLDDLSWAPLLQLNASYTYFPTYQEVLEAYSLDISGATPMPTFMVEAGYEGENYSVLGNSPKALREQAYWSLLSGATGQLFGNHYTWQFIRGWKNHLNTVGAVQFSYATALFEPRAWYDLMPDQDHTVVTTDYGDVGTADYLTAARTPNGELVMAYVPSARTFTVDLSSVSRSVIARWYDPAIGKFVAIRGSPFANSGPHDFTTPGNNAGGAGNDDWVLVLEAVPLPDLAMTKVAAPNGAVGRPLAIANTVRNLVPAPATAGAFRIDFYLSTDKALGAGDRLLGSRHVAGLTGLASSTATTVVQVPADVSPGAYYVIAVADTGDEVTESNEDDNTLATAAPIQIRQPDLAMTRVSAPKGAAGRPLSIANTVRNLAAAPAAAGAFRIDFYLSADNTLDGSDRLLGSRNLAGLAPLTSSAATTVVHMPADVSPGPYYIIAVADPANQVAESNENNNTLATAAPIQIR